MATRYATAVSKAGAVSQDPAEIDTNVTADTGATATPRLASEATGGAVTTPNMGFAGVNAVLDDTTYVDDADGTIGTVSKFAPGHGTNTEFANEKLSGMSMGGVTPGGTAAKGTVTIGEPVSDGDTLTIGLVTYTFKTTPAAAYDVALGAGEAAQKVNIIAAINLSGTPGTEYFAGTEEHPDVSAAAFVGDDAVVTAKDGGVAGDAIVFTETFTHVSNVLDGSGTLGGTTAGEDFAVVSSLQPIGISADVALVDQNA
jgi:hypothetical protein